MQFLGWVSHTHFLKWDLLASFSNILFLWIVCDRSRHLFGLCEILHRLADGKNVLVISGTILSPWVIAPFVAHTNNAISAASDKNSSVPDAFNHNSTENIQSKQTMVQYAYSLVSCWYIAVAALFLASYLTGRKERNHTCASTKSQPQLNLQKHSKSPVDRAFEPNWYRIPMLLLTALRFGSIVALESQFSGYLTAFTVKGLGRPKTEGLTLTFLFRLLFTVNRLMSIGIALCTTPTTMIIMDIIIFGSGFAALSLAVQHFDWVVWFGTAMAGFGMGSFFGASISWTEKYLKVTGRLSSILVVGETSGIMIMTFTIGHLFDSLGPMSFIHICSVDILLIIIIVTLCSALARHYKTQELKKQRFGNDWTLNKFQQSYENN